MALLSALVPVVVLSERTVVNIGSQESIAHWRNNQVPDQGIDLSCLGRKEEALREGKRALELVPPEKDAVDGPAAIKYLAMIAAWAGDKDFAFEQLATAIHTPSGLSYGQLKLLPFWDPLRGDSRFDKLLEEAKKPVELK